eukprot:Unigene3315_Nuclearia_a/m.10177 Unigene3315_Nuclearia_a/g.10177  ORF Unigene3315_Nuclearia_a/g.10177 Unigene3315_Nuclearia_a/m.10177 type:complete len:152 (-) Unigene3315_Nuclearia_a:163-618(-)
MLRSAAASLVARARPTRALPVLALRLYATAPGLKYTRTHEWVKVQNGVGTVGITHHAQDQLSDVIYTELPKVGETFEKSAAFGTVESVKASSDVYAPVSGTVVEVNTKLAKEPGLINHSPYEDGWLIKLKLADDKQVAQLLSEDEYAAHIK